MLLITFNCILRCDQLPGGLIAQLVEHCTGIAEVMGKKLSPENIAPSRLSAPGPPRMGFTFPWLAPSPPPYRTPATHNSSQRSGTSCSKLPYVSGNGRSNINPSFFPINLFPQDGKYTWYDDGGGKTTAWRHGRWRNTEGNLCYELILVPWGSVWLR